MANTNEPIDGYSLRNILVSADQLLGVELYQQALAASGLERFKDEPPPASPDKVATSQELSDFWKAVYDQVAFPTFRLFERNVGGEIAQASLRVPGLVALREKMAALPRAERLAQTVSQVSYSINLSGVQTTFRPYQDGFLLYFENCPFICDRVKTAEPLCHIYEYMFLKLLKGLSQLPLVSDEIECVAMGQPQCRYYFHEV